MCNIEVKGTHREGKFQMEKMGTNVTCTELKILDQGQVSDELHARITDPEAHSILEDRWILLHGTPEDIVFHMASDLMLAQMETDNIFAVLDQILDPKEIVTIVYPVSDPSPIILNAPLFKSLRYSMGIVACAFAQIPLEKLTILHI